MPSRPATPPDRRATAPLRFRARLRHPAEPRAATWRFVLVPKAASARLPTRGLVSVAGTVQGVPFHATLEPDGHGSHWLKLEPDCLEAAGVTAGVTVAFVLAPVDAEPEPTVPEDLAAALDDHAAAHATWVDITARARRDWIHWIRSGKKAETRTKRVAVAIDKLASGSRRACCFDRSGMYSRGAMGAPEELAPP